ncbi:Cd2+/Zn2+-exporting ATPase [Alteribacillus persepolensis]|uniref:Cd(2+)-exporting ATPase n=1 Tax=Alteribacillus persepolensis TaxID=568899 RepID=A0A1G8J1Y1_9BACI|nr:Cd2+/Zn2+-exporting ATPase [Alteribacillus persepolensis]
MLHLDGVEHAHVNFGASKLTVYGDVSKQQLEKAGAFENISLRHEHDKTPQPKQSFWKKHPSLLLSFFFLAAGVTAFFASGEESFYSTAAFLLSIIIGGHSLFRTGLSNLFRLQFDMKTLMTVAIIGAVIIGEYGEGAVVVILFAISEALERFSIDKARQSISSLMDIAPNTARVKRGGEELEIDVDDIVIGDVFIVKPGEKIAIDGVITRGVSTINQAAITGESVPVEKQSGDDVFAGTLNEEGLLEIEATKRVEDTTLAKIIHLVEEAQAEKAPSQAFIDRFAKYYTPAIMVIALFVAVIPPLLFDASWSTWVYQGLAVLVVGCPCALVISTPVSVVTAIGSAAKNGVLIKGGVYLEEMGALRAVAFDKTGTLTYGVPVLTEMMVYTGNEEETLSKLAALEHYSQHPLASAITSYADRKQLSYQTIAVHDFQAITGSGIQGRMDNTMYYAAKPAFFSNMPESIQNTVNEWTYAGKTVMVFGTDDQILAVVAVADDIRQSSPAVLKRLHQLGITETVMLTGDNEQTANAIGELAGVKRVQANLLPEDKLHFIKTYMRDHQKVAMVGDGVNDAPALANATVGVAMGGAGTDTALETADIALMADDLEKLPFTVELSRKALRIIKQNIVFSIAIKLFALLLVVPGWLTLWIAIFADMGATLLVTLNGLRLLKTKNGRRK